MVEAGRGAGRRVINEARMEGTTMIAYVKNDLVTQLILLGGGVVLLLCLAFPPWEGHGGAPVNLGEYFILMSPADENGYFRADRAQRPFNIPALVEPGMPGYWREFSGPWRYSLNLSLLALKCVLVVLLTALVLLARLAVQTHRRAAVVAQE